MSQLSLSNDLIEITAEINSYKQVAGQAVFEIGKRLKHVRDNDLAHGQWESWLLSVDISKTTAWNMIKAFDQFSNVQTSERLPSGKIFEMLSLPESVDRQQFIAEPQTIPSTGEQKMVDDMTVKELREVKKALQEVERRAAKAEAEAETERNRAIHAEKLFNSVKNQPPRVETRVVEKLPDDYQDLKQQAVIAQQLNSENVKLQRDLAHQREHYEDKLNDIGKLVTSRKELNKLLSEQIRCLTMNHDSAVFNYMNIQGDREAHEIVMRYLAQYESIIKKQFAEWEQLTTLRAAQ